MTPLPNPFNGKNVLPKPGNERSLFPQGVVDKMKTIIGTFRAKDANNRMRDVIITQELLMGKNNLVVSAAKYLNLDDQDGQKVVSTDDPSIFRLDDGSELKKIGSIELGDTL